MKTKAINYLNGLATPTTPKSELDLIEFIKKCVREFKVAEKNTENEKYIDELFLKFYGIYRRKGAKEQARKTFHKKLAKLKTQDEILEKARKIVVQYRVSEREWNENATDLKYVPLCSSWLNSNVPD